VTKHVASVWNSYRGREIDRPRLKKSQYYRVEQSCDDGVVSRTRVRTLRAAERLAADAEASGLTAEITIRGY
jgi:hypothetical protein